MKVCWKHIILVILVYLAGAVSAFSQDLKTVSGRVTNKTTGQPLAGVKVYSYNTVQDGKNDLAAFNAIDKSGGWFQPNNEGERETDAWGDYEILVAPTGSLLFLEQDTNTAVLVEINHRFEVNASIDINEVLNEAMKVEEVDFITSRPVPPIAHGDRIIYSHSIKLPANLCKSNARLVVQPTLLDAAGDTVSYRTPVVLDGEEYHLTQYRRMGYSSDVDPLFKYVSDTLKEESINVHWRDTVIRPVPKAKYTMIANIFVEDYNVIYYKDTLDIFSTDRMRDPMQFLEYSLGSYSLDMEKYRERAKKERRNAAGNISLTFIVGKAELDPKDEMNKVYLDGLKKELSDIIYGTDTQLKQFHIEGVASPDGPYRQNDKLASERMQYALNEILSVLPASKQGGVWITKKHRVATWLEVAEIMEDEGLADEAAQLKNICRKYKDQDTQWKYVRALPFYKSKISPLLPKLRSVKYTYVSESFRELTPEEILLRYKTDEEYISGKKHFALYEYWHLFQMLEDPQELEALYKRAYDESLADNGFPWILAANNLAQSYIKRGHTDVTVLAPFIDISRKHCNIIDNLTKRPVNTAEVVANQLIMYLEKGDTENASVMEQLLPNTDEYKTLKSFSLCLLGYYLGPDKKQARQIYNDICASSPINNAVMNLAMNSPAFDAKAEIAIAALDQDAALTDYLKVVLICREKYDTDVNAVMEAEGLLLSAFFKDPELVAVAASDADLKKDLVEAVIEIYNIQK